MKKVFSLILFALSLSLFYNPSLSSANLTEYCETGTDLGICTLEPTEPTPEPTPEPTCPTENKVPVSVFVNPLCKHCQAEKDFLQNLMLENANFQVTFYDTTKKENRTLLQKLSELEDLPLGTPLTLVGNTLILGFEENLKADCIKNLITASQNKPTLTVEEFIAAGGSASVTPVSPNACNPYSFSFFGNTINLKDYSLPLISFILGFIDGFNPCAMWVLVTFLVILSQIGSRRRMWEMAGLFILAEGIMYYLILNTWLFAWDKIGLNHIVTPLVGILAIGGGSFFLYEWYKSDGTCRVTNATQRSRTAKRIRELAEAKMTIATLIGIIVLAFSVNIIEFACSVGIPQAFTKILNLNNLSPLWKQLNMAIYILSYMLDDIIVFALALYSIEKLGLTTKYSRISHLVGGILMFVLGLLLIFNPDALVF